MRQAGGAACDRCLRRGHLLGFLAPRLADLLGKRDGRTRALLTLDDHDLIAAVCPTERRRHAAHAFLDAFDAAAHRAAGESAEITAVCRHCDAYPATLSDLLDAPPVLFVAGGAERLERLLSEPAVTIVGTRRASPYGLEMARSLAREIAAAGITVASGLALGIDAAAHHGACSAPGGRTIAVLARGPDAAYPRRHARLYDAVLVHGCVVSELPPGTPVFRWAFPARNRIMAALAEVTVVVEAADPSGSLITAGFASDLGRAVAAVPGRANARSARGSNRLLHDGAHVITGAEDVLELVLGAGAASVRTAAERVVEELDPELRGVLRAIEASEGHHEVAAATGLEAGALRAALARLELLGLIRRDELGGYVRAAP